MNAKATKPNTDQTAHVASSAATNENNNVPYWLLKEAKCKKLDKHSEGGIKYQLLASDDRASLHVRIAANAGVSLTVIQQLLGHKIPVQTMRYSYLMNSTLRDASEVISLAINKATIPLKEAVGA
ncbi:hypothetical protein AKG95_20480 [Janthinobacterium lividum]|uniref:Tyr recombinase domain-containing protein n=1 Tax=Janthinobacterium lividum TaxID=29581 RepID=A0A1S1U7A0_9BURK|nr:hypothetical protein [Janthinobacterium lividum]OHV95521.1 hypothetical protein AKG95_20480 [Janthinobacterium lividum]